MKHELPPLSLYIHLPWCIKKCPYCDFNSHAVKSELPELDYIKVLLNDLANDIEYFQINRPIGSIFIGGGTPSLFSATSIFSLLEGIFKQLLVNKDAEITLEANPSTFETKKFKDYREAGVNRLSIGVQSFNEQHLKKLGRIHNSQEALKAAEIAHSSGFDNFNLDLMFALPQQSYQQALADIKQAIDLKPSHISLYQLTLEPNTFFHRFPPMLPNDEVIVNMQDQCQQLLAEHNFKHYEVSAYAKNSFQCKHNFNYWQFGDYLGIGAGAHGKISQQLPNQIYRTSKIKNPQLYLETIKREIKLIKLTELPLEFMMNQLRLKEGFSLENYHKMTGLSVTTLEPALTTVITEKLLYKQQKRYFCTKKGWNFLDTVLEKFIT